MAEENKKVNCPLCKLEGREEMLYRFPDNCYAICYSCKTIFHPDYLKKLPEVQKYWMQLHI